MTIQHKPKNRGVQTLCPCPQKVGDMAVLISDPPWVTKLKQGRMLKIIEWGALMIKAEDVLTGETGKGFVTDFKLINNQNEI